MSADDKTIDVETVLEYLRPLGDRASEALASAYAAGEDFNDNIGEALLELNLLVWRFKWEIGEGCPTDHERLRALGVAGTKPKEEP